MKILAIRGHNLASLQGDFEVRFDSGPLQAAGLFAITGATGSGKSTLLDALCLALYDKTPRYAGKGGVAIGAKAQADSLKLAANDVRHLLRRGTAEGKAEVDFVAQDSSPWRATWKVRRSRRKIDGKLQAQEMSLQALGSEEKLFSGRKTDVLKEIEKRVGLSFEQFRRSVLLAQGDFAAFLKAKPDQRSELLERMTGTRLYSDLSRAAFERHKAEQGILDELRLKSRATELLSIEERKQLLLDLEQQKALVDNNRMAQEALKQAEQWYLDLKQHQKTQGEAEAALNKAQASLLTAAPRKQQLEVVEACVPLIEPLAKVSDLVERLADNKQRLDELEPQKLAANKALIAYQERSQVLNKAVQQSKRHLEEARPLLEQARRLDGDVQRLDQALHKRQEVLADLERVAEEKKKAFMDLSHSIGVNEAALERANVALRSYAEDEALHRQWPRWKALIEKSTSLWSEHRRIEKEEAQAESVLAQLQGQQAKANGSFEQAKLQRDKASEALAQAQKNYEPDALQRLLKQVGEDGRIDAQLEKLAALHRDHQRLAQEQRDAQGKIQRLSQDIESREATLSRLREDKKILVVRLEEAKRSLDLWTTSKDLEVHRAKLIEGEACPLCGSEAHPLVQQNDEILERLHAQQKRVQDLEKKMGAMADSYATAQSESRLFRVERKELNEQLLGFAKTMEAQLEQWNTDLGALPEPLAQMQISWDGEHLRESLEAFRLQGSQRRKKMDSLIEQQQKVENLSKALQLQREGVSKEEQGLRGLEKKLSALELSRLQNQASKSHGEKELAAMADSLQGALGHLEGWQGSLRHQGPDFLDSCEKRYERSEDQKVLAAKSEMELARLRPEKATLAAQDNTARDRVAEAKGQAEEERARLEQVQKDRAQLFEGRKTSEVQGALSLDLSSKEAAFADAEQLRQEALSRLTKLVQTLEEEGKRSVTLKEQLDQARGGLEQALKERGIDEAHARALLGKGRLWISQERLDLAAIDGALREATAVLRTVKAQGQEHLLKGPPKWLEEELPAKLAEMKGRFVELEKHYHHLAGQKQRNEALELQLKEIKPQLDAQSESLEKWKTLSELIGSADGKKFRTVAQSLTLEQLLSHANVHLKQLARRYRLERVPGEDLAIQVVDQDMGDEIRGVNSLSGGEGFLVSLALALGLASLSSRDVKIESLFIDEGFGTLDPDTLEMALATLDSLQSSGRKVGLISHVPGLAERIGYQVRLSPVGSGRSRVEVQAARSAAFS